MLIWLLREKIKLLLLQKIISKLRYLNVLVYLFEKWSVDNKVLNIHKII